MRKDLHSLDDIHNMLKSHDLKVTPQRVIILDAIYKLHNHPTAEQISDYVRKTYPSLSVGTVYKTLDVFVEKGIINKVSTTKDTMRYDGIIERHHHLHSSDDTKICDYVNDELDKLLSDFFASHPIDGYDIESIRVDITGKFK